MAISRRDVADSGLAFLDVVSCGFGAIILLLIITKSVVPEETTLTAEGLMDSAANLQAAVLSAQRLREELTEKVAIAQAQIEMLKQEIKKQKDLEAALAIQAQHITYSLSDTKENSRALAQAKQELSELLLRLSKRQTQKQNELAGGIPVDSEYVIFILDSSGSMYRSSWDLVLTMMDSILDAYPKVNGIQIMNDDGDYLFSGFAGKWIPDGPGRRNIIKKQLRTFALPTDSNPADGIIKAINTFWAPDKRISLYVFGDDFRGGSVENVVELVRRVNRTDEAGSPRVRIHGIGFPVPESQQGRPDAFATLMRELARRNGGTFVGLERFR
jgi:hypothetical protein